MEKLLTHPEGARSFRMNFLKDILSKGAVPKAAHFNTKAKTCIMAFGETWWRHSAGDKTQQLEFCLAAKIRVLVEMEPAEKASEPKSEMEDKEEACGVEESNLLPFKTEAFNV